MDQPKSTPLHFLHWRPIALISLATIVVVGAGAAYLHASQTSTPRVASSPSPRPLLLVPLSLPKRCTAPTVTASTAAPQQVGSQGAPRVGPIAFYANELLTSDPQSGKPYPSKVLIQPLQADGEVITLQGERCRDGALLLFAYNGQVVSLADESATFTMNISDPNTVFGGYMLFTSPGDWSVDVFSGRRFIGNIVITVVPGPAATNCPTARPIDQLIQQFVNLWNEHDPGDLAGLFTSDAELDMSSPSQGMQYQQQENEWTVSVGQLQIDQFAEGEWTAGERLSFSSVTSFKGGGYAVGMKAALPDGRVQILDDAKFVLDDCQAALAHVVIVATSTAR